MSNKFWNMDKLRVSLLFNIVLFTNMMILAFVYMNKVNECNTKTAYIEKLESTVESIVANYSVEIENYKDDLKMLKDNYEELQLLAQDTNAFNKELLEDNDMLNEDNIKLFEECNRLSDMLEKYEEYEVFMFTYEGSSKRTDCTYDLLEYLDELIADKAVNCLPFYCSCIMIESTWNNHDYNPVSTAYGLPQFLSSTGEWVYNEMLDAPNGPYNHEMVTDPYISLHMMTEYVNTIFLGYEGDLKKTIDSYRGLHDEPYLARFNKYLAYFDLSIDKGAEMAKENYDEMFKPKG